MKCLITGVAGFVGSAICRNLLSLGHYVVGIDSLSNYYDIALKKKNLVDIVGNPNFSFIQDDLNTVDIDALVRGIQVVFHQAGQPGVRKSWGTEFDLYVDANIRATQRLLEAVRGSESLTRLIYASSSSVYGEAASYPTSESDVPRPISPYGVTKLAAEHLCTLYAHNFGTPTVSLRYFTVYGPRQRPDMAFTRFIRSAIRGEKILVYGDGNQLRDFTYIDDVVAANIDCATADMEPGKVFNVAGGSTTSIRDVLGILHGLAGKIDVEYSDRVAGDVFRTGGATARIQNELGWLPRIRLEDGLKRQFDWGASEFSLR